MTPSLTRCVLLHGLAIELWGQPDLMADALGGVWAQLPLTHGDAQDSATQISEQISSSRTAGLSAELRSPERHAAPAVSHSGDRVVIDAEFARFELDKSSLSGSFTFDPSATTTHRRALCDVFLMGLTRLLAECGLFDLHGACVELDGRGLLLVGPSGSGKTTATLNLIASGADYVSDDAVLISRTADSVHAFSFRRQPLLCRSTLRHFPEFGPQQEDMSANGKSYVEPAHLGGGDFRESIAPTVILLCELTRQSPSRVEPVGKLETVLALMQQSASLAFSRERPQAHLALIRQLADQCVAFRIRAGEDLLRDRSLLRRLIRRALDNQQQVRQESVDQSPAVSA